MENLKIENSAEAQELLFGLGYRWVMSGDRVILMHRKYLIARNGEIRYCNTLEHFNLADARHITLDDLREYKPMLTYMEVIERLKNGLGVEIERKPNEWVKLTKFDSLKVFCSDYKFRGCE